MRAIDFLIIAEALSDGADESPARYRTSVSRAYYAAFHSLKEFVERELGARIRGGGNEHAKLQHTLLNCGSPAAAEIGAMLQSLHASRVIADYQLEANAAEKRDSAIYAAQSVRQILSAIDAIRGDAGLLGSVKQGALRYVELRNRGS